MELKPGNVSLSNGEVGSPHLEEPMEPAYWGHGFGVGAVLGLIWLAAVIYVLTLATRLVRAIERIAAKFESKP